MSKIYEALLRAEQERLARLAADPAGAASSTASVHGEYAAGGPQNDFERSTPLDPVFDDPSLREFDGHEKHTGVRRAFQKSANGLRLEGIKSSVWKPTFDKLPALEQRGSGLEQFRRLRSRMFELRDLNRIKSVLVASGHSNEGKSFVASNLAIALARHKASRVLLIDGDMRRGSVHGIFGCNQAPGLSEYLAGSAEITAVLQQSDSTTQAVAAGLASLTVIASGRLGDKAAELSGQTRFKELLEAAAPYFDWIVVDSSPVNIVTDGVNLARACDAVLLVARGGVTKIETVQHAVRELKATNIVGVVLNAVHNSGDGVGYGGYDSYSATEQAGV